jgi:hypothetical protein
MSDTVFPFGYSGDPAGTGVYLTWSQMMTRITVNKLHPEVLRRVRAFFEYASSEGVPLGVGTGWRIQPNPPPPGFAKPGNSWHESVPVSPSSATALAIDTVPASSWAWMEQPFRHDTRVTNCAAFGLRTFRLVGSEPWHIQPKEIPTSRRFATVLPPLAVWPLPDVGVPVPPDPIPPTPVPPTKEYPVEATRSTVKLGSTGKMVKRAQFACQLITGGPATIDGDFGQATDTAIRNFQTVFGLTSDGQVGPKTWAQLEGFTG